MADDIYSLSEDLRRETREKQESFRLAIQNEQQRDPARTGRILSVSAVTGLPNEVVDADLDNLERMVSAREFDEEKWRKESPAWTSFAAENPYHLSVLKEDQEQMGAFERSIKQVGLGWDSTWATVELGRLRARQIDGDIRDGDEQRLKELKQLTVDHEFGAENPFVKFLVKNAKMAGPTLASMKEGFGMGLGTAVVTGGSVAIAGQAGPQALIPEEILTVPAATALGFKAGFATGAGKSAFDLERGFAYDEYLEMGVDPQTAKMAANSVGAINAALETVSIGKAVKYVPFMRGGGEKVAKRLAGDVLSQPTVSRATMMVAGRFGEVLGTEIVTEVMQETVTAVTGEIVRQDGGEMTWDDYVDRMSNVALETLQGAAIMSSIGPGMSYYTDLKAANNAKGMRSVYEALGQSASESKIRKNVPAKYREFVERLTKDGPVSKLYIDAGRFREYFQESGQDPDAVADMLGVTNLDEAVDAGLDIEVSMAAYAEKIAPTEAHSGLVADLKSNENEMSAREAEQFEKNKPERLRELEEVMASVEQKYSAERDDVFTDVLGQLIQSGVSRGAAEKQAELVAAAFHTLGERENIGTKELYEQFFGGVKSVQDQALGKTDVDILIDPLLNRLRDGDVPQQRDIYGVPLFEFLKNNGGIWDDGGELHARDVGKQVPFLMRKEGMTLDHAAEVAHEAGYLPERDIGLLLDAIDKEMGGEPIFGPNADPEMATLDARLNELGELLEMEGIDLQEMSNIEVRKALSTRKTFDQLDDSELADLTNFAEALVKGGHNPDILSKLEGMMPRIDDKQEIGDAATQKTFDRAVKKRSVLQKLLDCVGS